MSKSKVQQQADALWKEAVKLGSKSLFQWKPQHLKSADKFEKAAQKYLQAKCYVECVDAHVAASAAFYAGDRLFSAARNSEQAAIMLLKFKSKSKSKSNTAAAAIKATDYYRKAAEYYREDAKPDKAADMLTQAAKKLLDSTPSPSTIASSSSNSPSDKSTSSSSSSTSSNPILDQISNLFEEACNIYVDEDRHHMSGNTFRAYIAFLCKYNRLNKAVEILQLQNLAFISLKQPHNIWKNNLSIVILYLYLDDYTAAENAHQTHMDEHNEEYPLTPESNLALRLLYCFDKRKPDELAEIVNNNKLKLLQNEIAKKARTLKIQGVSGGTSEFDDLQGSSDDDNDEDSDEDLR